MKINWYSALKKSTIGLLLFYIGLVFSQVTTPECPVCEVCEAPMSNVWYKLSTGKDGIQQTIKLDMFSYISCNDLMDCYIGEEMCDHEGYVLANEFGTYKVVNREVFSFFNFTMEKAW